MEIIDKRKISDIIGLMAPPVNGKETKAIAGQTLGQEMVSLKESLESRIQRARTIFYDRAKAVYHGLFLKLRANAIPDPGHFDNIRGGGYMRVTLIDREGGQEEFLQPVFRFLNIADAMVCCDGAIHIITGHGYGLETISVDAGKEGYRFPLLPGIDRDKAVSADLGDRLTVTKEGEPFREVLLSDGRRISIVWFEQGLGRDPDIDRLREFADGLERTLGCANKLVNGQQLPKED